VTLYHLTGAGTLALGALGAGLTYTGYHTPRSHPMPGQTLPDDELHRQLNTQPWQASPVPDGLPADPESITVIDGRDWPRENPS
jgi:hypothetical protein